MAFDNSTIKPVHPFKPHICFRDGWWRVSSLKGHLGAREKFNKAHMFITKLNDQRWGTDDLKAAHKQRLLKLFGNKFLDTSKCQPVKTSLSFGCEVCATCGEVLQVH